MANLQFTQRTIAPAGRNKYGNYLSKGNVTKSVVTTTYAGNDTTTTIGNTGVTENTGVTDFYCMLLQTSAQFNSLDLQNHATASTQVIAYRGYEKGYTLICDMDSVVATVQDQAVTNLAVPENMGIRNVPSGISVGFTNNGTSATTINFTVSEQLSATTEGTLYIPVCVYKRGDNIPLPDDVQNWWEHQYRITSADTVEYIGACEVVWLEWSWKVGGGGEPGPQGESAWYLTLTNDNASINCDADGNIIGNPSGLNSTARLYHGNTVQTSAVTYNVDYGGASGITRSSSTGATTLKFGTGFTFSGHSVAITISASTENILRDVKVMNVTKVYPGADGSPAVSYEIKTSFGDVLYNPNTKEYSPQTILVRGTKYEGAQEVSPESSATIYYSFGYGMSFTPESACTTGDTVGFITITSAICENYGRIRLTMKIGLTQVDQEDIDIIKDGVNGQPGEGRKGAAIRGPYKYDEVSGSTRCWCAGESGGSCTECEKWIDVVLKDNVYYYCNTTYYGTLSSHFPAYWTSGDSFDFVATRILLAQDAAIDFLTNNELYLRDEHGNITGGAKGGSGITFWAGGDLEGDTEDLPFRVMTDGTMYAKNGVFGGYIQMPYTDASELEHSGGTQYNPQVTYFLDTRAYVIVGPSGIGTPSQIVLPLPNASLNGFVYYVLVKPARLNMQSDTEGLSVNAIVSGRTDAILDYVYQPYGERQFEMAGMFSGKYQFVCANIGGSYKWLLTEATGGAQLYGTVHSSLESDYRNFRPVFGFQRAAGKPEIKNISTETGYTDDNTLYVEP